MVYCNIVRCSMVWYSVCGVIQYTVVSWMPSVYTVNGSYMRDNSLGQLSTRTEDQSEHNSRSNRSQKGTKNIKQTKKSYQVLILCPVF